MKKFAIDFARIAFNSEDPKEDRGYTLTFFGGSTEELASEELCFAYVSHMSVDPGTMLPFFDLHLDPINIEPEDLTEEVETLFNKWADEHLFEEGTELRKRLAMRARDLRN